MTLHLGMEARTQLKSVLPKPNLWLCPGGREDNSRRDAVLSDYLNNELQGIKTSLEPHAGKRERLSSRCQPGEGLLPRKRVHTALTSETQWASDGRGDP